MNQNASNIPPSPEWNPEGEKKKTSILKWLLVALVVVIMAAGGFFYYYYIYKKGQPTATTTTSTTDETSNWQTYKNTTYGYSLKYPQEWQVDEKDVADVKFSKKAKDATLAADKILFEVKGASDQENTKLADWVKDEFKDTPYTFDDSLLGGKEAITITKNSDETQAIFLIADNTKYRLLQADGTKEDFNKIAKTFKLIAKETSKNSTQTSSAEVLTQTYTNENYGYSVKYPEEWVSKDMNATKEEDVLDQVGFQPTAASDTIAFSIKITNRTVDNEVILYKAGLEPAKLVSEIDASLGGYSGKKITSTKGSVETAAIFLKRGDNTFIIIGETKNPTATYKLYFDQMIASIMFI